MKYAVKVPFDGSMLYVIDAGHDCLTLCKGIGEPLLFDTEDEATQHAQIWGNKAVVVEYKEEQ